MIYGYVRVSTDMQDYQSQKNSISRRFKIDIWIEDTGTGRKTQPNLTNLLTICKPKDEVIVSAFDRLGRNLGHVIELADVFKRKGVALLSVREGIDMTSASGNMVFQMMASIAEFESHIIADRVKNGMRAAKARGVNFGPRRKDQTEKGKAAIELAKDLRSQGMTIRQIQQILIIRKLKLSAGTLSKIFKESNLMNTAGLRNPANFNALFLSEALKEPN